MKARMISKRAIIFIAVAGLVIPIIACSSVLVINESQRQRELNAIASRLGVAQNWNAVRYKVYCDVLARGKSQQQVELSLAQLGRFRDFGVSSHREYVFVGASNLALELGLMRVQYVANRITDVSVITETWNSDATATIVDCKNLGRG